MSRAQCAHTSSNDGYHNAGTSGRIYTELYTSANCVVWEGIVSERGIVFLEMARSITGDIRNG